MNNYWLQQADKKEKKATTEKFVPPIYRKLGDPVPQPPKTPEVKPSKTSWVYEVIRDDVFLMTGEMLSRINENFFDWFRMNYENSKYQPPSKFVAEFVDGELVLSRTPDYIDTEFDTYIISIRLNVEPEHRETMANHIRRAFTYLDSAKEANALCDLCIDYFAQEQND